MRGVALSILARGTEALACICFAGFLIAILAQISYRYLGISLVFSEEIARMLNVYVVFIGIVAVTRFDGHIKIDLVERYFVNSVAILRIIRTFHLLMALAFFIALAIGSFQLAQSSWGHRLATVSWISHGHVYLAPLIGSVLSIAIVLIRLTDWKAVYDNNERE